MSERPTLRVELFGDGGIRITPPAGGGNAGPATATGLSRWLERATSSGDDVLIEGALDAPLARNLLDAVNAERVEHRLTRTEPEPWHGRWSSLMFAAANGLTEVVVDLLARGAPTGAPRRWSWVPIRLSSPYRLAMRRGYIDTMRALRDGGVNDPVRTRPPGAPNAVVMRPYIGAVFKVPAALAFIVGLLIAAAARSPMAGFTGGAIALCLYLVGHLVDAMAGRTCVAVDDRWLYYRRLSRWRKVDLRHLAAIGIRESAHPRSATLLRLANTTGEGEPIGRPTTHGGLDADVVERLRQRPGEVHVLTVSMTANYLRPGLERHVAGQIDPAHTMISASAQHLAGTADRG